MDGGDFYDALSPEGSPTNANDQLEGLPEESRRDVVNIVETLACMGNILMDPALPLRVTEHDDEPSLILAKGSIPRSSTLPLDSLVLESTVCTPGVNGGSQASSDDDDSGSPWQLTRYLNKSDLAQSSSRTSVPRASLADMEHDVSLEDNGSAAPDIPVTAKKSVELHQNGAPSSPASIEPVTVIAARPSSKEAGQVDLVSTDVASLFFAAVNKEWKEDCLPPPSFSESARTEHVSIFEVASTMRYENHQPVSLSTTEIRTDISENSVTIECLEVTVALPSAASGAEELPDFLSVSRSAATDDSFVNADDIVHLEKFPGSFATSEVTERDSSMEADDAVEVGPVLEIDLSRVDPDPTGYDYYATTPPPEAVSERTDAGMDARQTENNDDPPAELPQSRTFRNGHVDEDLAVPDETMDADGKQTPHDGDTPAEVLQIHAPENGHTEEGFAVSDETMDTQDVLHPFAVNREEKESVKNQIQSAAVHTESVRRGPNARSRASPVKPIVNGKRRVADSDDVDDTEASDKPISWEAKLRGLGESSSCQVTNDLYPQPASPNRKKPKVVAKEQNEIAYQLSTLRASCLCEEVVKLGVKGNIDRFTNDVTRAWRDSKGANKTSWTPEGSDTAAEQTICQAKMSIGDKLYSCVRSVDSRSRGQLYRPSPSHPVIALCQQHASGMKNHHCCPVCGVFCEAGEFRACQSTSGHLFHIGCTDKDRSGRVRCAHCMKPCSPHVIGIKNPGLLHVDFAGEADCDLFLIPRQPRWSTSSLQRNPHFVDFPVGFRVSCAYLTPKPASHLERTLRDFDTSEQVEMEWIDLTHLVSEGDINGVLQFISYSKNLEKLYAQVRRRREETEGGTDSQFHFALTGPVHVAVKQNRLTILAVLLQAGFPMNHPDASGLLPFEQAALANHFPALLTLKKFYAEFPPGSIREGSLRKLLRERKFDGVALLFRAGFYDLEEFAVEEEERRRILCDCMGSESPLAVSNFLECPHFVGCLRNGSVGSEILTELLKNWKHKFAVEALQRLGIQLLDNIPEFVGDEFSGQQMVQFSTGGALPAAGSSRFFDGADDRVVDADLSKGLEFHRVELVNKIDDLKPLPFVYITHRLIERQKFALVGYGRTDHCACSSSKCDANCACVQRSHRNGLFPYKNGCLDIDAYDGSLIEECSQLCRCGWICPNRVVQNPSLGFFQVFCRDEGQWGLRSKFALPRGFFIGKFLGSVVRRESLMKALDPGPDEAHIVYDGSDAYAVVTRESGNYTRFLQQAALGNVIAVIVTTDDDIGGVPRVALFTKVVVGAYEPLVLETKNLSMEKIRAPLPPGRYRGEIC